MNDELLKEIERDMALGEGERFARLAADYLESTRAASGPVSTTRTAAELVERFAEPLPRRGRPLAEIVERIARDVVPDSNKLHHPMYMGHQVSAPLPAAVWSETIIAALNQSVAVWEMSPVATVIETQLVR